MDKDDDTTAFDLLKQDLTDALAAPSEVVDLRELLLVDLED